MKTKSQFDQNRDTPASAWRAPTIAYYSALALKALSETIGRPRALDLGCNDGANILALKALVDCETVGVDHNAYEPPLDRFYKDSIDSFLGSLNESFDLTIVAWIYVHSTPAVDGWRRLQDYSRAIVTFENEAHIRKLFPSAPLPVQLFDRKKLILTRTFEPFQGTTQTLRIFVEK